MSPVVPEAGALEPCVEALAGGAVVALPTDTVYGLAALPGDREAMAQVFELKGRDQAKSVAVLVADGAQAATLSATPLEAVSPWWPGPLTVVVRRAAAAALHLGADPDTVGIRCPDHELVRALARRLGPLAVTSANRSGEPTPARASEVAKLFPTVALVVDGGILQGAPSTVVDLTASPPKVLRQGALAAADLASVLARGHRA